MHVHVEQDSHGCFALDDELMDASAAYFRPSEDRTPTLAHDRRALPRPAHGRGGVHRRRAHGATGHPPLSSEEIADQAAAHADVLIPFGSVDPHAGTRAVARARRLVTDHGVRGFKFHPSLQAFEPNDTRVLPALRGAAGARRARPVPHRADRDRRRPARRARHQAALLRADAARRRRRRLPGPDDRHGAPVGARGRTRPSPSPRTRPTSTSTSPAGRRSTSRRSWSAPPTGCSSARCCSAPTSRSSPPTAGSRDFDAARHQARGPTADPQGQRRPRARARLKAQPVTCRIVTVRAAAAGRLRIVSGIDAANGRENG